VLVEVNNSESVVIIMTLRYLAAFIRYLFCSIFSYYLFSLFAVVLVAVVAIIVNKNILFLLTTIFVIAIVNDRHTSSSSMSGSCCCCWMQVASVMRHVTRMVNCAAGELDQLCARHVRLTSPVIIIATLLIWLMLCWH